MKNQYFGDRRDVAKYDLGPKVRYVDIADFTIRHETTRNFSR